MLCVFSLELPIIEGHIHNLKMADTIGNQAVEKKVVVWQVKHCLY